MQLKKAAVNWSRDIRLISFVVICLILLFSVSSVEALAGNYCEQVRTVRQRNINSNPLVELKDILRKNGKSNCFSPAENLYFISIMEAQKHVGKNALWYEALSKSNRKKAKMGCKVMGYGEGPLSMALDKCIQRRFHELMIPYNAQYQKESAAYIDKRNSFAEKLVSECVTAFHQNLPKLPRRIQFPLAYYDKKLRAYPGWYFESKIADSGWIENMQNTYASTIVKDTLAKYCPGDMVYWLYL